MSKLFSPLKIGQLELSNRIVIAPMCQYSAEQGDATDWHMIHLGHLALSGAGLLILEATAVSPEARISPADLGLYSDRNEQALARVLKAVRQHSDMPIGIQLAHAGRKASTAAPWDGGKQVRLDADGWQTEAPSALPYAPEDRPPTALDDAGLARIREAFGQTARRAARLGLDMIEVHAAHGYLLHQFLSPLSNSRTDDYGGSFENRTRFVMDVVRAVRGGWPMHKPLFVRLSATDWAEGGWDLEQTVKLAGLLSREGVDVLDVSSGGLTTAQQITPGPGYQVPFASAVKQAVSGLNVMAVGMIESPEQAEGILQNGEADLIALARPFLGDPHWSQFAAQKLAADLEVVPQYQRGHRLD
ncbi:MAG: NADH:flavin oxidoreductase/NADH oxidase [Duganella sp.]